MNAKYTNKIAAAITFVVALSLIVACGPTPATEAPKVKVALMMANSCDDQGFGTPACEGLAQAAELYDLETSVSERVPIPDAATGMRDWAERGYDLIIGHGFQYGDAAVTVAEDYPETWFAITYGGVTGENIVSIDPKNHEIGYLAGIVAGSMTETKILGYVAGMEIPGCIRLQEGFRQGAESVDPEIVVLDIYDVSFDNVQLGKEAGEALIQSGADVIFHDAGISGQGTIQAAAENGVYAIGFASCQRDLAPDLVLTSTIEGISEMVTWVIDEYLDGNLKGGMLHPGTQDGIFTLCPYNDVVPQEVRDLVEQAKEGILSGELYIEEILSLP